MKTIVADTGPLIALSRMSRLDLLPQLFGEVLVPQAVVAELCLDEPRCGVADLAAAVSTAGWLSSVKSAGAPTIAGLDAGESAAICLAQSLGCPLLLDERRARRAAVKRAVPVIGTGRVLIAAKEHGLIESVAAELVALRQAGYRLSSALCRQLTDLAGEAEPPQTRT